MLVFEVFELHTHNPTLTHIKHTYTHLYTWNTWCWNSSCNWRCGRNNTLWCSKGWGWRGWRWWQVLLWGARCRISTSCRPMSTGISSEKNSGGRSNRLTKSLGITFSDCYRLSGILYLTSLISCLQNVYIYIYIEYAICMCMWQTKLSSLSIMYSMRWKQQ